MGMIGSLVRMHDFVPRELKGLGIIVDEREKEYMVAWIESPYLIFTFERRIGWHLKNSLFILSEAKKHEYCKKDK
jgi:hypothetical protein